MAGAPDTQQSLDRCTTPAVCESAVWRGGASRDRAIAAVLFIFHGGIRKIVSDGPSEPVECVQCGQWGST